jgi:hypothetical protein
MALIDIKGLDKAEVLLALWNSSRMQGMSFLGYNHEMTLKYAQECVEQARQTGIDGEEKIYFDYLNGKVMKIDLAPDEIDPRLYDLDNGDGAAQTAIDNLRLSKCSNEDRDVELSDVCAALKNQAKKPVVDEDENRVATLLRAAKELLIKQRDFGILMDFPITVHYDDADCDGYCLIYDINAELDALCEKSQDANGQQNQAEESRMEEHANLITLEDLIKTLKRNAAAHFLSRRGGKRYVMSIYYQLNRLQAIEAENAELRKRIKELEQEEG